MSLSHPFPQTFFGVKWSDPSKVRKLVKRCKTRTEDGHCLFSVSTRDKVVFKTTTPTRKEVLSKLSYGAFHPDVYGVQYDTSITADNVTVYTFPTKSERMFEVIDGNGMVQRRKNLKSIVRLDGTDLSFSNPVHFISFADPTQRDALYETDAAIDHLFYHENTAPFVAKHLAQRFGMSNASPRFIRTIAEAFRTGRYCFDDGSAGVCTSFGEGKYGDLGASIAAVLLDREARDVILDKGPSHGSMKEPILRILNTMRSLEFKTTLEYPIPRFSVDLQQELGQMPYAAPSIFSFFSPEHQPSGVISKAGLVSPESQIHTNPHVIAMVNGIMAMSKYGMDSCYGGFGYTVDGGKRCSNRVPGVFANMTGHLGYLPSSVDTVVDELSTMLTSGRLNPSSRALIKDALQGETDTLQATIKAQQLIATTAEFHTTGTVNPSKEITRRRTNVGSGSGHNSYKALVVVMLEGGYDSYNLIVPHKCEGQEIRKQYRQRRGMIRLKNRTLTIDATGTGQPCDKFAIHNRMKIVHDLYEQDSLCFFMNTGLLKRNVTKENYDVLTESLFAHNAMQKEAEMIDPFNQKGQSGFLGRLVNVLNGPEYKCSAQALGINRLWHAIYADPTNSPNSRAPMVVSETGVKTFNPKPRKEIFEPRSLVEMLNRPNKLSTSSVFGESWSQTFMNALDETDFLANVLDDTYLPVEKCGSDRLNMVVRLMQTHKARGSDRDVYFVNFDGWDHHVKVKHGLDQKFKELNEYITCYVENLKALNLWDNVTMVVMSEFGRTLSPNTNEGSDRTYIYILRIYYITVVCVCVFA